METQCIMEMSHVVVVVDPSSHVIERSPNWLKGYATGRETWPARQKRAAPWGVRQVKLIQWRSWTYGQTPSRWFLCWTHGGTDCRHRLWVSWVSSLGTWEEGLITTTSWYNLHLSVERCWSDRCIFRSHVTLIYHGKVLWYIVLYRPSGQSFHGWKAQLNYFTVIEGVKSSLSKIKLTIFLYCF